MSLTDLTKAIQSLKPSAGFIFSSEESGDKIQVTEAVFNKLEWVTGEAANKTAIITPVNPHPELTWSAVKAEMDRLQTEYDALDYARKRKAESPDIYDYMDGIVKNDQTQIDKYIADAQDVKARHPKGG